MKIIIECEYENMVILSASSKKYLQFRENIAAKIFRHKSVEIEDWKLKKFHICCDKCSNWIAFGVD